MVPQGVGQPDVSSALTRAAVVRGEATSKSDVEAAYRTYEAQLGDVGTAALLMLAASEATTHTENSLAGYELVWGLGRSLKVGHTPCGRLTCTPIALHRR